MSEKTQTVTITTGTRDDVVAAVGIAGRMAVLVVCNVGDAAAPVYEQRGAHQVCAGQVADYKHHVTIAIARRHGCRALVTEYWDNNLSQMCYEIEAAQLDADEIHNIIDNRSNEVRR